MERQKRKILIIDDEEGIRQQMRWGLQQDYDVFLAADGKQGLQAVRSDKPDLVVLDLSLTPNGDEQEGLQVFEDIQLINPRTKVIIVTGNEQRDLAVKAVQMGAYDFYRKPIELEEFKIILERALHLQKLEDEVQSQALQSDELHNQEIIGQSPQMLEIYDTIRRTSQTDATILITGESGTGKELVARAIHLQSPRKERPFIVINCGAIPENLLESELFGHEKGAFTGAHVQRKGRFELANKGTIFLDEIGELSVLLQAKILRFLQEREIERVGGREPIEVDVRIIAATNRNLEEEIEKENFRADLFYRLSVITINLPPLRERGEDIPVLANKFLRRFKQEYQREVRDFSAAAKKAIRDYAWPGNVRELENKVKRAVIMARQAFILPEDMNLQGHPTGSRRSLKEAVEEFEQGCIREALLRNGGNVSRTAAELGVNRTTFYDMLHKYNIDHSEYSHHSQKAKSEMS